MYKRQPYELGWAQLEHGAGFRVMAIAMADIPARLAELDPDQPIACLCHHGVRSMQVARFLASNGFGHVVNICLLNTTEAAEQKRGGDIRGAGVR